MTAIVVGRSSGSLFNKNKALIDVQEEKKKSFNPQNNEKKNRKLQTNTKKNNFWFAFFSPAHIKVCNI